LVEPRSRRCETCGQNLRRREPLVLGDATHVSSRQLPIDRWMSDRARRGPVPALSPASTHLTTPGPVPKLTLVAPPAEARPTAVPIVEPPVEPIVEPLVAPTPAPVVAPPAAAPVLVPDPPILEPVEPALEPEPMPEPTPITEPAPYVPAAVVEPVAIVEPEPVVEPEPEPEPARPVLFDYEMWVDPAPATEPEPEPEPEPITSITDMLAPFVDVPKRAPTPQPAPPEPGMVMLAVGGEPVRYVEAEMEAALDALAQAAREEILAANAPAPEPREAPRKDDDGPWLAPIRKAWEPPAEDEQDGRSRWSFFRRTG
jgi:hypothetical protein